MPLSLPRSKPQASRETIIAQATVAWAAVHGTAPLPARFVFAVRGYYSETFAPAGNNIGEYDDAFFIVQPDSMSSWNGNSDPSRYGLRPEGQKYMARLKPGCWWFRKLIHRGKYQAFGQGPDPVTVERIRQDGSIAQTETGEFGINLHLGGINGTSSEGCPTVHPVQWSAFRKALNLMLSSAGMDRFVLILAAP
jgi:lysozyme